MVTNFSGNVIEQRGDYPYGEMWYQSASNTDFQFRNYLRDSESGNDYAYAREYVNRLARFSSLDPVGGNASDPLRWNPYGYTEGDPVNLSDSSGACMSGGDCQGSFTPDRYGCDEFAWAESGSFCNGYIAQWTDPNWSPCEFAYTATYTYFHPQNNQEMKSTWTIKSHYLDTIFEELSGEYWKYAPYFSLTHQGEALAGC